MGPHNQRSEMVKVNHRLDFTDDTVDVKDVAPSTRTVVKIGSGDAGKSSHTIKLVIGEPVDVDDVDDVDEWDVEDELAHSCCQFFDQRRETWSNGRASRASTTSTTSLQDKMDHLRREIVSLVDQDDALFRQLLALNTSIHELRSQQRALTRNNASVSPCSTSMASSLASSSDGDEDSDSEDRRHSPTPLTRHGLAPTRKRAESKRTPSSLTSSSPTWSTSSRSSQESRSGGGGGGAGGGGGGSGSGDGAGAGGKNGVSVKGVPRSPHASFYSRVSIKTPDRLMVVHKRQGSYDSGIQGSEPSDAEVFV